MSFLITKDDFYNSELFNQIANEAGITSFLDDEEFVGNSQYLDKEGNLKSFTPRQLIESGGPRSNLVKEVEGKGNVAISNADHFKLAAVLNQVLNDQELIDKVTQQGVSVDKLRSDLETVNPVYENFLARIQLNTQQGLKASEYQKREKDEQPLVPSSVQPALGVGGFAVSQGVEVLRNMFFESNEDQRQALVLRGVKPQFIEKSYEDFAPIDSEHFYRVSVSPVFNTPDEYMNIIRPIDPTAQVVPINPLDIQQGLLIKSKYNPTDPDTGEPAWLPVSNVQPVEGMLEGDFSPALRELAKFGVQEGAGLIAGGGLVTIAGKIARNRIQKRLARKRADIETGIDSYTPPNTILDSAKEIGLTTLGAASGEAVTRFGLLALGSTEAGGNVQPDLTFERAVDDSQALFQAALLFGAGGDVFLRSLGAMWGKLTGRPVQSEIIDEMIVESRVLGENIRGIARGDALPEEVSPEMRKRVAEVIDESGAVIGDALSEAELSPTEIRNFTEDASTRIAQVLKNQEISLGQLSDNERILAFEELLSDVLVDSPVARRLEKFHQTNSIALEQFYRDILRKAGLNPRDAQDLGISKETLNDVFTGIKSKRLVDQLSEEERGLADKMSLQKLENVFNTDLSRKARQESAETIQERVQTAQSQAFPDSKSRLIVQRSDELEDVRSQIGGVLERDIYNDPKATVKLPKYIKASLDDFLNANKQEGVVFGSADATEAEQFIRDILPNREQEGISIQLLLGQGRDPVTKTFLPQRDFTQRELILTRENLSAAISGHPNKVIREKGQALLDDIDRAIDDNFRVMYKLQTGKTAPESMQKVYEQVGSEYQFLAQQLSDKQQDLSARFLVDLANKDESEIGTFIRTTNPGQIRALTEFISRQDGGLEKLQSIKNTVLESIQREVDLDRGTPAEAASRFSKILKNNEEQLRALFPEDFVKFTNYKEFLNNAQEAVTKSQANIRGINRELEKLTNADGTIPTLSQALDNYFNLSITGAQNIRETPLAKFVNNIGEMAEEYPDLRSALQQYFAEEVVLKMRGRQFRPTPRGRRMRLAAGADSTFNIEKLNNLILTPFSTDREAARFLEPIVGKDEAFRYAKDLRILARLVNKQKGFAGNPLEKLAKEESRRDQVDLRARGPKGTGFLDRARRAIFGPLDLTATRIGIARDVFVEELTASRAKYLGQIVSDPAKLRAYLRAEELKLPVLAMYQVTAAIAAGRFKNIGSEENQKASERIRDELANLTPEQGSMPERILRIFDEFSLSP